MFSHELSSVYLSLASLHFLLRISVRLDCRCLVTRSCPTLQPHRLLHQASLSFTISQSLLKLTSIDSMMPSNHLILCCPLLLLPSIFPSIRVFFSESAHRIRWPKYWRFSFSIKIGAHVTSSNLDYFFKSLISKYSHMDQLPFSSDKMGIVSSQKQNPPKLQPRN